MPNDNATIEAIRSHLRGIVETTPLSATIQWQDRSELDRLLRFYNERLGLFTSPGASTFPQDKIGNALIDTCYNIGVIGKRLSELRGI